ncbi:GNAT family N-acetyltransferase [Oscillatoria sp. CS-180]|uniref:GNAT family N-acetyltransferase n=1 Tax=Oscillatoria sp. CS-180 TaxID=3021720 RepID=UPI00232B58C6|nr:GNAT family N-acetyltransferase [Oscillatoria sp. CS-180]MDB9525652.1 GNAT family N-acetyltransferase [Oscillatoria sp. CS-180]
MTFKIRDIQAQDNTRMAEIIRQVLTEFGANRPGFAWTDPEIDTLFQAYGKPGSVYLIATVDDAVVGGGGIAAFPCEYPQICELQKMYVLPEFRGRGIGTYLLKQLLKVAQDQHYQGCYLETFGPMQGAIRLYETLGFTRLSQPLGNSGHCACDRPYLLWFNPPRA